MWQYEYNWPRQMIWKSNTPLSRNSRRRPSRTTPDNTPQNRPFFSSGILRPDPAPDRARNYCYLFPRFYVGETDEKWELCPVFGELNAESMKLEKTKRSSINYARNPGPDHAPGQSPDPSHRRRVAFVIVLLSLRLFEACPARVVRHSSA